MSALVRPLSKPATITFGIGSALGAIACGYVGYRIVFSSFATYDDEGYFLVSIQEWLDRGQLYDGVYSEYGPGYFTLVGGLFGALGGDVDHDTARLITLGIWLAVSVLAGLSLLRLTGNPLIALAGQLLAFVVLVIMHQDPMYPGAWLALVLIAIPAAVAFLLPTRPALGMFSIGALRRSRPWSRSTSEALP